MSSTIAANTCHAALPASYSSIKAGGEEASASAGGVAAPSESLIQALQGVVDAINRLIPVLQQYGSTASGGGSSALQGALGAPVAPSASSQAVEGAGSLTEASMAVPAEASAPSGAPVPAEASAPLRTSGGVDPSSVRDKDSGSGLNQAARNGLDVAHSFGLPLVSGRRSGGSSKSDHTHGNAIDVSTLKIGDAGSTEGTAEMKSYAEHMREAGKRGDLNVKYVIHNGQIASARENWAWRPYTYPGKSAAQLDALKQSNRGEYNRIQHYDHVHVSFKD